MRSSIVDRLKRFITPIFIILIILFFILYLKDIDYRAFSGLEFSWLPLLVGSLISLLFRYWGVFIWRTILSDLGARSLPSFTALSDVYARAWMARYIPGTVTWIAGKIYMANKLGISKSRLAVSSILEAGVQIVATLSLSLLILALDPRLDVVGDQIKLLLITLAVGSMIVLLPPVLNRALSTIFRFVRKKAPYGELQTNARATLRSYVLYVIGAFIAGSSYYLLSVALYPQVGLESYWFIVGTFTLAGALGMATPFVPSGLGVREGVQLVLLSLIMPKEIALAITVFSRLWSAAIDVLFYITTRTRK